MPGAAQARRSIVARCARGRRFATKTLFFSAHATRGSVARNKQNSPCARRFRRGGARRPRTLASSYLVQSIMPPPARAGAAWAAPRLSKSRSSHRIAPSPPASTGRLRPSQAWASSSSAATLVLGSSQSASSLSARAHESEHGDSESMVAAEEETEDAAAAAAAQIATLRQQLHKAAARIERQDLQLATLMGRETAVRIAAEEASQVGPAWTRAEVRRYKYLPGGPADFENDALRVRGQDLVIQSLPSGHLSPCLLFCPNPHALVTRGTGSKPTTTGAFGPSDRWNWATRGRCAERSTMGSGALDSRRG